MKTVTLHCNILFPLFLFYYIFDQTKHSKKCTDPKQIAKQIFSDYNAYFWSKTISRAQSQFVFLPLTTKL